jgi:hypothetical protein
MRPELTLLLFAPLLAFAADDAKPAVEATVQFISLAGDRDDLALWDGRKATPLRLSAEFFGPKLRYAGDARLMLVPRPKDAPAAPSVHDEAKPKRPAAPPGPPVAWLDLPTDAEPRRFILLVQPEAGRNGIVAIKDTPGDFPQGAIRLLNLCDFPVTLEDGRRVTAVDAKGTAVVSPDVPDGAYYDAQVFSEEDRQRRLAFHLHFFHARERRTLLFILPVEKGTGLVRLQPVEEPPPGGAASSPHDARVKPPKGMK